MKKPKVPVVINRVQKNFLDQLTFLEASLKSYDDGRREEYKRIAVAIRVLLHDNRNSTSLAEQLGLKGQFFISYVPPLNPHNLSSESNLIIVHMTDTSADYLPALDFSPFGPEFLDFDMWWNRIVIKDSKGNLFSRRDLVLTVADQDGGAHSDPEIDSAYHDLANLNSMGWVFSDGSTESFLRGIEQASLRHIGFEVITTLRKAWESWIGNQGCQCGSGRKARFCCMKGTVNKL